MHSANFGVRENNSTLTGFGTCPEFNNSQSAGNSTGANQGSHSYAQNGSYCAVAKPTRVYSRKETRKLQRQHEADARRQHAEDLKSGRKPEKLMCALEWMGNATYQVLEPVVIVSEAIINAGKTAYPVIKKTAAEQMSAPLVEAARDVLEPPAGIVRGIGALAMSGLQNANEMMKSLDFLRFSTVFVSGMPSDADSEDEKQMASRERASEDTGMEWPASTEPMLALTNNGGSPSSNREVASGRAALSAGRRDVSTPSKSTSVSHISAKATPVPVLEPLSKYANSWYPDGSTMHLIYCSPDTGVDDWVAQALVHAMQAAQETERINVNLLGIVPSMGNGILAETSQNAGCLAHLAGHDSIPVYTGERVPLADQCNLTLAQQVEKGIAGFGFYGPNGLPVSAQRNTLCPEYRTPIQATKGYIFVADSIENASATQPITLISTSSVTGLSKALSELVVREQQRKLTPGTLFKNIRAIYMMGGVENPIYANAPFDRPDFNATLCQPKGPGE